MAYGIDYKRIKNIQAFVVKPVRVYPPEAAPKATRAVLLFSLFKFAFFKNFVPLPVPAKTLDEDGCLCISVTILKKLRPLAA